MYSESMRSKTGDADAMAVSLVPVHDGSGVRMVGDTVDRIFKGGKLVEVIFGHNLIVNSYLNLVSCLLKQQNGYKGIQYWAVGKGGGDVWGSGDPPAPDINATRLTSEIGRVPILPEEIVFLNQNFEVVNTPSNIIQITHVFGTAECNGEWREFGIFGGNATSAANSGIMINKRHHKVITKTSDMTVERVMRFTLALV